MMDTESKHRQLDSGPTKNAVTGRLLSLDFYRGLVLLLLCTEAPNRGGWKSIVDAHPDSQIWSAIAFNFQHVEWVGISVWDMIQPSFMFMVGVSMAFSYAKRQRLGQSWGKMLRHACFRSLILILLGVFLRSVHREQTEWVFKDVLAQIGLGYVFLFLLWNRNWRVQLIATIAILVGYWALFAMTPIQQTAGNPKDIPLFEGFLAHWNLNANPAHSFDIWFLNLFPRAESFEFDASGYNTLNFIPSLAIMAMGLMAGELLRSNRTERQKLLLLISIGIACALLGWAAHVGGICPLVKKTWTPTFTLVSGGLCFLTLAVLYGLIDIAGQRVRWLRSLSLAITILGMNSIALYVMIHLLPHWFVEQCRIHFGQNYAAFAGAEFAPLIQNLTSVLILWLICFWMYHRKIFLRI